jgi:hypothetical protein
MPEGPKIRWWRMLALAAPTLAFGCSSPASSHRAVCAPGFVGEASQAPDAHIVISDGESGGLVKLNDGDRVPLIEPPQGGYVIYVGVEARNLDPCGVEVVGSLRDRATGDVLGYDGRTVALQTDADGWARPKPGDLASVANVNPCPSYGASDVVGNRYDLEVKLVDRAQRTVTTTVQVVPSCMQGDAGQQSHCVCTCSAGYFLGKCNFNGGAGT